jgi:topoisomerase IV subunit A
LSAKGRLLVVDLDEVKVLPAGGRGVALLEPDGKGDALIDALGMPARTPLVLMGAGRTGKPVEEVIEPRSIRAYVGKRARKGKALELKFKPTRLRVD